MDIKIEIGKDANGEPIFADMIHCEGYLDIEPRHIKVHIDPRTGSKKRHNRKPEPELDLDDRSRNSKPARNPRGAP